MANCMKDHIISYFFTGAEREDGAHRRAARDAGERDAELSLVPPYSLHSQHSVY
jgi:hypothetical protein